jgi:type IV pilus assembly protein PilB
MRISDSLAQSLLKRSGGFTEKQLVDLRSQLAATKRPLQDLIIQNGLLSETELTRLYADELSLPFVELSAATINRRAFTRLPEHVATRYNAVVFDIDDNDDSILVAMEDPTNPDSVNFLKKQLGDNLKLHVTSSGHLRSALNRYQNSSGTQLFRVLNRPGGVPTIGTSALMAGSLASESINHILEQALGVGASTIHIEPHVDHVVIRYRVDGLLREAHKLPSSALDPLLGYIKSASQMKLQEHHTPQYGHWGMAVGDQNYTVRVTILPTVDGEKAVLHHIVPESTQAPSLRDLGLWGSGLHDIQKAVTQPHGTLLVVGPIGSGKSTTLFSLLSALNSPRVSVATIEDPVEYRITGANQIQLNPASGVTLKSALQAVLGQDPNIIMLSEIDEPAACKVALKTSLSGHLVLSTLHTASAAAGVKRLLDMGIEPHMIASGARAIVGQRLARKLCPDCREATVPGKAALAQIEKSLHLKDYGGVKRLHELEALALEEGVGVQSSGKTAAALRDLSSTARSITRLWKARDGGCDHCHHTGYRGRVGIFEVLVPGAAVEKTITHKSSAHAINQAAIESGMVSMQLDGLVKALRGQTTVAEVLRVTAHG